MLFYEIEKIDISSLSKSEAREYQSKCGCELLEKLLKTHFGIERYEVKKSKYGKPFLDIEGVYFSISHSGDFVCCALADSEVGVDIEAIESISCEKIKALAKRFFTQNEFEYLSGKNFYIDDFYFIWTRKEAFSKCKGSPLMPNLSINILENEKIVTEITEKYVFSIAINI